MTLRGWRHDLALLIGAPLERIADTAFCLRHPPRGLLHADTDPSAPRIARAIEAGTRFLYRQQGRDGSLRGFCLFPGASRDWVTAHVAFVVEAVPALDSLAARAAAFLARHGADDGGWGYNRRVAVDCDSTAQALMVVRRFGLPLPAFVGERLAGAQAPCGAYPTYVPLDAAAPAHGWQAVHAEVTAMVLAWLRRDGGHPQRTKRCEAWLANAARDGVLPAYWWSDDAYALWLQARLDLLSAQATPAVEALLEFGIGCPQLAMVLSAALTLACGTALLDDAVRRLLAAQLEDGSWPCAPCLRVTAPAVHAASRDAAGEVVADRRRVFATAHAVAALQAFARSRRDDQRASPASPVSAPSAPGLRPGGGQRPLGSHG